MTAMLTLTGDSDMTVEPKLAKRASWVSIICSFILSAETWVKLAELAGFTGTLKLPVTLPIIGDTLRTSWAMVGVVDAYVISALVLWTFTTNRELATFARKHTYGAAITGVAAQAVFHGWGAYDRRAAIVVVVLAVVIGAIPPLFAAFGIHMRSIGVLAARTGVDSDKLTAGLLSLSLMHGAADTAIKMSELRARLADMTDQIVTPVTVTPTPVTVTPVVTVTPQLIDAVTGTVIDSDTGKPRSKTTERRAWLADNPTAGVADLVLHFGVSERTAFRDIESLKANQA
jgi:hypothetical protein